MPHDLTYEQALIKYMEKSADYEVTLHGIKEVLDQAIELLNTDGKNTKWQAKELLEKALKKYWSN